MNLFIFIYLPTGIIKQPTNPTACRIQNQLKQIIHLETQNIKIKQLKYILVPTFWNKTIKMQLLTTTRQQVAEGGYCPPYICNLENFMKIWLQLAEI